MTITSAAAIDAEVYQDGRISIQWPLTARSTAFVSETLQDADTTVTAEPVTGWAPYTHVLLVRNPSIDGGGLYLAEVAA